ncbi:MAG: tetratricopeptide repeat protein [Tumebacillaceae bacterium]
MMRERLDEAIQLREEGRAKQDLTILDQVRAKLSELLDEYPDVAEINYQMGIACDNSGLGKEAIGYYVKAIEQGLGGADLERCLLGLGSTYRALGFFQESVETLRRGVREFPENRAIQIFLSMALYNSGNHKEAMELALTTLLETTNDEKLQYYKRGLSYYSTHLDETW